MQTAAYGLHLRAVLHQFDGLERVTIDRHTAGLRQLFDTARWCFFLFPVLFVRRVGVNHQQDDVPDAAKSFFLPIICAEEEFLQRVEHAADADVVGNTTINQVNVRPVGAVVEHFHLLVAFKCPAGRPLILVQRQYIVYPARVPVVAITTVVVQGNR